MSNNQDNIIPSFKENNFKDISENTKSIIDKEINILSNNLYNDASELIPNFENAKLSSNNFQFVNDISFYNEMNFPDYLGFNNFPFFQVEDNSNKKNEDEGVNPFNPFISKNSNKEPEIVVDIKDSKYFIEPNNVFLNPDINFENTSKTTDKNKLMQKRKNQKDNNIISNKAPILCKIKHLLFDSMLEFDNNIISKTYNNNIGNYINKKKLLKIKYDQTRNNKASFNKELLKKTQKEIFSEDITSRFTCFPADFNKQLIERLLNEEDEEKRKIFNNLFNKTFLECIQQINGTKKIKGLEGLEEFYKKKIIKFKNPKYYSEFTKIFNNYETEINNIKPRKRIKV